MAKPKKTYFKEPKTIPWAQAKRMKRIPRGVWIEPKVPERGARDLHVKITPKGVAVPRYAKIKEGELAIVGHSHYPSLSNAVRAETHKINSVRDADTKLAKLYTTLGMVHADIHNNWSEMNWRQRSATINRLQKLRDNIEGGNALPPDAPIDKVAAVERLDEALADLNAGRVATQLVGVKNDLIARRGDLKRQMAFMPRRREALIREKHVLDLSTFTLLDRVSQLKSKATRSGLSENERDAIATEMRSLLGTLRGRGETQLRKTAHGQVKRALAKLESGDAPKAADQLRRANRTIVTQVSNHTWIYPWRLEQIAKTHGKGADKFKMSIAARQIRIYRENLDYWLSGGSHEPLNSSQIANHLELIGSFFPGTGFDSSMKAAASNVKRGKNETAKKALVAARGKLD